MAFDKTSPRALPSSAPAAEKDHDCSEAKGSRAYGRKEADMLSYQSQFDQLLFHEVRGAFLYRITVGVVGHGFLPVFCRPSDEHSYLEGRFRASWGVCGPRSGRHCLDTGHLGRLP